MESICGVARTHGSGEELSLRVCAFTETLVLLQTHREACYTSVDRGVSRMSLRGPQAQGKAGATQNSQATSVTTGKPLLTPDLSLQGVRGTEGPEDVF